jgi:hypothetical protein
MSEQHSSTRTPGATEPNVYRPVRWAWCGAFIITAIFGFGLTPWQTIAHLAENKGPGDEGTLMLAFAAGYTLPATAGVLAAVLIVNRKVFGTELWPTVTALVGVFAATAVICRALGLGVIVDLDPVALPSAPGGHWLLKAAFWVFSAYANSYSFGLLVTALAIGAASAFSVIVWLNNGRQ